jgi:hypothetical protein
MNLNYELPLAPSIGIVQTPFGVDRSDNVRLSYRWDKG